MTALTRYINSYADLMAAFGCAGGGGFNHYLNYGYGEKRLTPESTVTRPISTAVSTP